MEKFDSSSPSLPQIDCDAEFCFDCGPHVPCFNRCCADLALPLTPYDVLRLKRQLDVDSGELLGTFTTMSYGEQGFPLPMLRMIESPDAPCPFVTPAGCSVYDDRPGACRAYPLGRGSKISESGTVERFFMVREDHCRGFDAGTPRTASQWLACQGLEQYNYFNDRYMRLISLVGATGRPLPQKMSGMCVLALYQVDKFRDFIQQMNIFARLESPPGLAEKITGQDLAADEACLEFGFDWIELVIFGKAANLRPATKK